MPGFRKASAPGSSEGRSTQFDGAGSGSVSARLVVPFATAAIVFVAAGLGSFVSIGIRELPSVRCVAGGVFAGFYWASLPIGDILASNLDLSAIALFALVLAMPLVMPLLIITVGAVFNWWTDR